MSQQTVNITPLPQRIDTMIAFYESLNDVGKAQFILTIQEEDRQPFLDAYEEHYNRVGESKAA
ncbi:hypothetical protein F4Z99_04125 [Candidatus Poribacteria bacterium]|nr:hypothetical protein [Candidatus Poribacteria bacterium]MYB02482.1 hypothetical protein [Candidatus Poribacteria bacterium]